MEGAVSTCQVIVKNMQIKLLELRSLIEAEAILIGQKNSRLLYICLLASPVYYIFKNVPNNYLSSEYIAQEIY